jgi:hypothetical protein
MLRKPPADHRDEPGYREWHEPVIGPCAVCGVRGTLVRHHVVREQDVRKAEGDPWELRNSILIGAGYSCRCHRRHHDHFRRISLSLVPAEAIAFARELLGAGAAEDYLARHYQP